MENTNKSPEKKGGKWKIAVGALAIVAVVAAVVLGGQGGLFQGKLDKDMKKKNPNLNSQKNNEVEIEMEMELVPVDEYNYTLDVAEEEVEMLKEDVDVFSISEEYLIFEEEIQSDITIAQSELENVRNDILIGDYTTDSLSDLKYTASDILAESEAYYYTDQLENVAVLAVKYPVLETYTEKLIKEFELSEDSFTREADVNQYEFAFANDFEYFAKDVQFEGEIEKLIFGAKWDFVSDSAMKQLAFFSPYWAESKLSDSRMQVMVGYESEKGMVYKEAASFTVGEDGIAAIEFTAPMAGESIASMVVLSGEKVATDDEFAVFTDSEVFLLNATDVNDKHMLFSEFGMVR